ncbi:PREDICTED: histone-lysine N-methyltransferase, H3 lysine-79 specific-like [Rhagoletis zephyria]|uniref:histone-lysine N-methyltransferase, H3 lysine-79 specific-like n=1 Tax=Rhagoletis zephyria TaxID=28612 RepID=UPI00081177AD|nr:PREDICTED: histone-lysine N-methyltransferase, H3 lysine-79 specific-like [Rhagoletis zephyria]
MRKEKGKPLTELLDNLPNHGVGRLIIRASGKVNLEAPTYMRILEVDMSSQTVLTGRRVKKGGQKIDVIKIPVKVEDVRNGIIFPKPVNISRYSYLHDFVLVAEDEEEKFLRNTKTAKEVGYFHWNSAQRRHIKEMVEGGMSKEEAERREKERIVRERAVQGRRVQFPRKELSEQEKERIERTKSEVSNFHWNSAQRRHIKELVAGGMAKEEAERREKERIDRERAAQAQRQKRHRKETIQEDFGEFSAQQKERIERMVKNGMDPDIAKQLEWEKKTALEAAAYSGLNEAGSGRSCGLKRFHERNK